MGFKTDGAAFPPLHDEQIVELQRHVLLERGDLDLVLRARSVFLGLWSVTLPTLNMAFSG